MRGTHNINRRPHQIIDTGGVTESRLIPVSIINLNKDQHKIRSSPTYFYSSKANFGNRPKQPQVRRLQNWQTVPLALQSALKICEKKQQNLGILQRKKSASIFEEKLHVCNRICYGTIFSDF